MRTAPLHLPKKVTQKPSVNHIGSSDEPPINKCSHSNNKTMFNVFKQVQEATTCRKKDLQLQMEEKQERRRGHSAVKGLLQESKHMVLLHYLLRVRRNFRGRRRCINLLRAEWLDTLQWAVLGQVQTRNIPRRLEGRRGVSAPDLVVAPPGLAGRPAAAPRCFTRGDPPISPLEHRTTAAASRRSSDGSLRCRCSAGSRPRTRRASTTSRGRATLKYVSPRGPSPGREPSTRASHSRPSTER